MLHAFLSDFEAILLRFGVFYDAFRLLADVLSAVVLVGMAYFLMRRFVLPHGRELRFHENVLLHPRARAGGIQRDSLIVGSFILLHVGRALTLARRFSSRRRRRTPICPSRARWQCSFQGADSDALLLLRHFFFWLALGGILLFLPYFPHTKHAHIFMAPLNFLTRPPRTSPGALPPIGFR